MTAFSASIERAFAAADGPEWHRLTPPTLPVGLAETTAAPPVVPDPDPAAAPARQRRRPRRALMIAGGLALAVAATLPLWRGGAPAPVPSAASFAVPLAPTTPILVAEATRRAADRPVDLATSDLSTAAAWLAARGLGVPGLVLPQGVGLAGVFLDHIDTQRVAGLALDSAEGGFVLYLIPPSAGLAPAIGWAESGGLMALAGPWRDWQAILVGASGQLFPPALADRLRGLAVAR
jgi:hypothetical protein